MLVIPINCAQCERGFSAQRRIKSDVKSSLHDGSSSMSRDRPASRQEEGECQQVFG